MTLTLNKLRWWHNFTVGNFKPGDGIYVKARDVIGIIIRPGRILLTRCWVVQLESGAGVGGTQIVRLTAHDMRLLTADDYDNINLIRAITHRF
jgi:hypothetical protein